MSISKKFSVLVGIIFTLLIAGCGGSSDLGMTTKNFAEKYNAEIDQIAKEQNKNLEYLKIVRSQSSGETDGYFELADKIYQINWRKSSADAKNINRVDFRYGTSNAAKDRNSVFLKAVANTVAAKEDAKKVLDLMNRGSDELNIFVEDKGLSVAVTFSPRTGDKTCFIAASDAATKDEQILKIKDTAKKEQEYLAKSADDKKWREERLAEIKRLQEEANSLQLQERGTFDNLVSGSSKDLDMTAQEFLDMYNKIIDSDARLTGRNYTAFKPTAPVNNADKLTFNSGSFRVTCIKEPRSEKICAVWSVFDTIKNNPDEWNYVMSFITETAVQKSKANAFVGVNL